MFESEYGLTQVDHVLITTRGIFVIEVKNYNSWIYGNKFDREWTQNSYGKKWKFYNPLRQNYGHLKAIQHSTGIQRELEWYYIYPLSSYIIEHKHEISRTDGQDSTYIIGKGDNDNHFMGISFDLTNNKYNFCFIP